MSTHSNSVWTEIEKIHSQGYRQKGECTCGPASLSLVSKALGIFDVSEVSWISQEKKRWLSVDQFLTRGMALSELAFAAELGLQDKAEVILKRAFSENERLFREDLKLALRAGHAIIPNFIQDTALARPFSDNGYPHYSPVAGLKGDSVLIADVDTEVKEAYWVPISVLFQAMAHTNPAFGMPRGWLVIRKRELER